MHNTGVDYVQMFGDQEAAPVHSDVFSHTAPPSSLPFVDLWQLIVTKNLFSIFLHPKTTQLKFLSIWTEKRKQLKVNAFRQRETRRANLICGDERAGKTPQLRLWFQKSSRVLYIFTMTTPVDGRNLWWLEFSQQLCFSLRAHADVCPIFSNRPIELVILITVD